MPASAPNAEPTDATTIAAHIANRRRTPGLAPTAAIVASSGRASPSASAVTRTVASRAKASGTTITRQPTGTGPTVTGSPQSPLTLEAGRDPASTDTTWRPAGLTNWSIHGSRPGIGSAGITRIALRGTGKAPRLEGLGCHDDSGGRVRASPRSPRGCPPADQPGTPAIRHPPPSISRGSAAIANTSVHHGRGSQGHRSPGLQLRTDNRVLTPDEQCRGISVGDDDPGTLRRTGRRARSSTRRAPRGLGCPTWVAA